MKQNSLKLKYCPPPPASGSNFLVDHVRILPEEQITFHQHEMLEVSYIIRGSGTRVIGNTLAPFSEGEIIFIPSNIPHCWSFDSFDTAADGTIENISIFFSAQLLQNIAIICPEISDNIQQVLLLHNAVVFTGKLLAKMRSLMKEMAAETQIGQFSGLIKLVSMLPSADEVNIVGNSIVEDRNNKRLQRIYAYVVNNFQREIQLAHVAQFVGMDRSSFCTFFKKMTGKSFFTFLTEYRIESSAQMLEKTTMTVAEICNAAGYNDVPHFNRVFKQLKQITPTGFRLNVKNGSLVKG